MKGHFLSIAIVSMSTVIDLLKERTEALDSWGLNFEVEAWVLTTTNATVFHTSVPSDTITTWEKSAI